MKAVFVKNQNSGFTLIEVIVSMSLFIFVIMSIMGLYLSILRLEKRTRFERSLTQNGRFIYEFLEKEITNGHVDYAKTLCGQANSNNDVYLVNQANENEHIYLKDADLMLCKAGQTTKLSSNDVRVTK